MTIISNCVLFIISLLFYEKFLALCLSFVLRLLLWSGAILFVRKKCRRLNLYSSDVDAGDEAGGLRDEWCMRTNFWGFLKAKDRFLFIRCSVFKPNINGNEEEQSLECLQTSITSTSCHISSLGVSFFVQTQLELNQEQKRFLLELALRQLHFSARISTFVFHEEDCLKRTSSAINFDVSLDIDVVKLYLLSPSAFLILLRFLKRPWSLMVSKVQMRRDFAPTPEERHVTAWNLSKIVEVNDNRNFKQSNLQNKASLLSSLVGGIDACRVKIKMNLKTEKRDEKSAMQYGGLDCSLCLKKLCLRLRNKSNLKEMSLSEVSISSDYMNLSLQILSSKTECVDNDASSIKIDPLLIYINISSNNTSEESLASFIINKGISRTSSKESSAEVELFSSVQKISYLLRWMQGSALPILLEIKKIQIKKNEKTSNYELKKEKGLKTKAQLFTIETLSSAVQLKLNLLDDLHMTHEITEERENIEPHSFYRLEFSTNTTVQYSKASLDTVKKNNNTVEKSLEVTFDACIRLRSRSECIKKVFLLNESQLRVLKRFTTPSKAKKISAIKLDKSNEERDEWKHAGSLPNNFSLDIRLDNVIFRLDDSREVDHILQIINSFRHSTVTESSKSRRRKSISSTSIQKQTQIYFEFSCKSTEIYVPVQNHAKCVDEQDYSVYFLKIESIALKRAPQVSSHFITTTISMEVRDVVASMIFTPHDCLPLNKSYFEDVVCSTFEQKSYENRDRNKNSFLSRAKFMINNQTRRVKLEIHMHELKISVVLAKEVDRENGDESRICGPTVDLSVGNLVGKEHVNFCDGDESIGQQTVFLNSDGLGHVSICREKYYFTSSDAIIVQIITIQTHGYNVQLAWSPILQWFIISAIEKFIAMTRHYILLILPGQEKAEKKSNGTKNVQTNIEIFSNDSLINTKIFLRGGSIAKIAVQNIAIKISHNVTDSWKTPNIHVDVGKTSMKFNQNNGDIINLDAFSLRMTTRRALREEVNNYLNKEVNCSESLDDVVTGTDGKALLNTFEMTFGKCVKVELPPTTHLGRILDDLSNTYNVMIEGLKSAGLEKRTDHLTKKYQIMDIIVSIPMLDAVFLELLSATATYEIDVYRSEYPNMRFARSKDPIPLLKRWRFHIVGILLTIKRNTPRAITQNYLRTLDEDKSNDHIYGPMIQGGDMSIQIGHLTCILHPLTIANPLGVIKNCKIKGFIHFAALDPRTKGLKEKQTICIPVKCHHALSNNDFCGCLYGIEKTSSGVPVKIYMDIIISCKEVHSTYGSVVGTGVPKLMEIIKRLIPVTPEGPLLPTTSEPLSWWDNLRYQFHGNICFGMDQLSFRWLLDTVPKYDWSILLTCRNVSINHSVGMIELNMEDTIMSVPGSSYHMIEDDFTGKKSLNLQNLNDNYNRRNFNRHSLLLFPHLKLTLAFQWQVLCPKTTLSSQHHDVYIQNTNITERLPSSPVLLDKFERYRSHGVKITLRIDLSQNSLFSTWVALRADVLPWLTHKVYSPIKTEPSPSQSKALPEIIGMQVNLIVKGLQVATWFDENGDLSLKETLNSNANATDSKGICLIVPKLHFSMDISGRKRIDLLGTVQAGLFAMSKNMDHQNIRHTEIPLSMKYQSASRSLNSSFPSPIISEMNQTDLTGSGESPLKRRKREVFLQKNNMNSFESFERLEFSSHQIKSLDYLLIVDQINIFDQSLDEIKKKTSSALLSDSFESQSNELPSTHHLGQEKKEAPWTVLVAGMRLLWTLEIRDNVVSIVKDLLFAINFMRVNLRGTPQLLTESEETITMQDCLDPDIATKRRISDLGTPGQDISEVDSRNIALSGSTESDKSVEHYPVHPKSHLNYLLDTSLNLEKESSHKELPPTPKEATEKHDEGTCSFRRLNQCYELIGVIPTFDLHLSNPQIQLHSENTGGSVILAIRGASVEGKKFLNLVARKEALESKDLRAETLLRKTEFMYTLDRMEIYSLNNDVDVDLGLQWLRTKNNVEMESMVLHMRSFHETAINEGIETCLKEYESQSTQMAETKIKDSNRKEMDSKRNIMQKKTFPRDLQLHEPLDFILPYPFKQIMNPSTFKTRQEFHRPPIELTKEELAESIRDKKVLPFSSNANDDAESSKAIDHIELFIDELSFRLDSYQFVTTLDVIRNVLLEPPKPSRERYYRSVMEGKEKSNENRGKNRNKSIQSGNNMHGSRKDACIKMEECVRQWNETNQNSKKMRERLRLMASEILGYLEENQGNTIEPSIRRVEYTLSKAKWKMISPGFVDDVEIDFTGFRGVHDFTADGSVNSQITLEDMYVASLKPGPDSMGFSDPTTIIKTTVGTERSACQRCGSKFDRASNELTSCIFHPGNYIQSRWTCCGASSFRTKGCMSLPHTGIERVLSIRFDALPRIVDGLTMYKHMEANIYPGMRHILVVQLTKSLTKTFSAYFLGDSTEADVHSKDHMYNRAVSETSSDTMESDFGSYSSRVSVGDSDDEDISGKKGLLFGKSYAPKEPEIVDPKPLVTENDLIDGSNVPKRSREIFFLKNWRAGEININLSITGFHRFLNIKMQSLLVPYFRRAYKIGSTNYLLRKFLAHLIKNLLSCGLVILRDKLSGMSPRKQRHKVFFRRTSGGDLLEDLTEGEESDDPLDRHADMLLGQPPIAKTKEKKKKRRKK